jgi:hypothetical protein
MKRSEFITVLGSVEAWPLLARGQQGNPARRIGVLASGDENYSLAIVERVGSTICTGAISS